MAALNLGEKDSDGRQKRIEHSGEYLRASRTGGVSLRAQTRVADVNVTGNTSHGLRVSTRLARNTQVAMQNGRFVLRGRYGSDVARLNLSKSGVSVSSKTPVGALNWFRPARSSFKLAGVQVRGHKAVYLQVGYFLVAAVVRVLAFAFRLLTGGLGLLLRGVRSVIRRRELAAREKERPGLSLADVEEAGARIVAVNGLVPERESARDLLAAVAFVVVCLGRGRWHGTPAAMGMAEPADAAGHAFQRDVQVAGEQLRRWLGASPREQGPVATLGVLHALASALAPRVDASVRAETLLALDDACLVTGPRTVLQEEMIDLLAETLAVDLVLEGEE